MRWHVEKVRCVGEIPQDQAEGLRRLLAQDAMRVVTLTSGRKGSGKSCAILNLAAALARRGRNVMILDENADTGNVSQLLGLEPRYDLIHVIRREKPLEQVLLQGPDGIVVVPAAQGVKSMAGLDVAGMEWLVRSFRELPMIFDVVLVDAKPGLERDGLSLSLAALEVVVVVSDRPSSITDAYALIKVLSRDYARREFHILINGVGEAEARTIFAGLTQAANRFLNVSLDFMGYVPADETLRKASNIHRTVVDAFPTAPAAAIFRGLAETLEQWPCSDPSGQFEGFMQRLVQSSRITERGLNSGMA
jgi:flagellar biosynthesis protein FlhG